jgi:glutathione S-transferase
MRLISATPSPYARKVRIALAEKRIPFELVTEVPWNDDTSTPQHNPLEKLPILILDDGATVYESRFILEYLELKHPEPRLLPRDVDSVLAAKRFEVLADGVCDALVLIFLERARAPERRSPEWEARQYRKVQGGLKEIARTVTSGPFVLGDSFGLADIAVGCLLGYLDVRFPEFRWREPHPNLAALSDRLAERPSFKSTIPVPQTITGRVA